MARDDSERLLGQFRSMQGDMVPSVMRTFDRDDLQLIHSAVLSVLDREGDPPTMKQLAESVGRSVSRTSRLVEQLVGRGLVERREDAGDRRVRRIRLTAPGEQLIRRVQRMRVQALLDLADHLTDDERSRVIDAMDLLVQAAKRLREGHGRATS